MYNALYYQLDHIEHLLFHCILLCMHMSLFVLAKYHRPYIQQMLHMVEGQHMGSCIRDLSMPPYLDIQSLPCSLHQLQALELQKDA